MTIEEIRKRFEGLESTKEVLSMNIVEFKDGNYQQLTTGHSALSCACAMQAAWLLYSGTYIDLFNQLKEMQR